MVKMRVYEYAKQYNISSKEVISKLKELGIEVTNHMATIEADAMNKLDGIYKKGNNTEASIKNPVQKQPQHAAIRSASDGEKKGETVKVKTAPNKASTNSQSNTNNRNKAKTNHNQNRNIRIKIKGKTRRTFSNILNLKRRRKENYQQKSLLVNH